MSREHRVLSSLEIMDAASEGILVLDEQEKISFANSAASEILKIDKKGLIGAEPKLIFSDLKKKSNADEPYPVPPSWSSPTEVNAYRFDGSTFLAKVKLVFTSDSTRLLYFSDLSPQKNAKKLVELLGRATEDIGSSLNYQETMTRTIELPLPLLSDWTAMIEVDDYGQFSPIDCSHSSSSKTDALKTFFSKRTVDFCDRYKLSDVVRCGEPKLIRTTASCWLNGSTSSEVLCLPIENHNEVVALYCLGVDSPREFARDDIVIAQELAARIQVALANAKLHEDIRRIQDDLKEAKNNAEEASRAKTTFLAAMSHEIRTPLTAILGFAELIHAQGENPRSQKSHGQKTDEYDLESPNQQEHEDWVMRIRQNGDYLLRLIDDILNLSKVESGKIDLEFRDTHLPELIANVNAILGSRAKEKGIELHVGFASSVPAKFRTDPTRLHQILANLAGNAVKFTERGHVEINLRYEPKGSCLIIDVSDTGPGLTQAQAAKLFAPFTQADASHTRRFGGTGLGLSLSRQLARLLGGDVELVETEKGRGTRFQMHIPIVVTPGTVFFSRLDDRSGVGERQEPTVQNDNLSGLRILVVDDSEDNRVLVSRFLRQAGAEVHFACNGREAIQSALNHDYSVVLMDIQMPVVDGIQATMELRRRGFLRPIITLSAHALAEERRRCDEAGCDSYLTKPVNRNLLISTIIEWSKKKHSSHRAETREKPRSNQFLH